MTSVPASDETLLEIFQKIWESRGAVAVGSCIWLVLCFLALLAMPSLYRATMIVAPADGYALGDYASSRSDGDKMNIPFWRPQENDGVSTDFHRFIYTIKGPSAAAILLKDNEVLSGIARDGSFARDADDWNAAELADYLDRRIEVQVLGTTPLRKLVYKHPDPKFAAAFLRKIHLVADQLIRRERRRQSESRIAYLSDTLAKTSNPDHRRGIADLLAQQEHIQMLANLDEPYAAIVVESAAASARPVWPNKVMVLFVGFIFGGLTGFSLDRIRKSKKSL